jgi:hypothetical protein
MFRGRLFHAWDVRLPARTPAEKIPVIASIVQADFQQIGERTLIQKIRHGSGWRAS